MLLAAFPATLDPAVATTACLAPFLLNPAAAHGRRPPWRVKLQCLQCVRIMNRLGDIRAENGRIPNGEFERWAVQLMSMAVQRALWAEGSREMTSPHSGGSFLQFSGWGLVISREQGLHHDAGFAAPVLIS